MKKYLPGFVVSLLLIAVLVLTGCHNATSTANKLDNNIQTNTTKIVKSASDAQADIASADTKVSAATTQPGNPAATVNLLNGAHTDLGKAQKDLAPIAPAAVSISSDSHKAAAVTATVEKKLVAEKDHWIGYKGRVALWSLAILLPLIGVGIFIAKTAGGGPIISAAGEVLRTIFTPILKGIVYVFKFLFHIVTLGLSKFADLVNKHWAKQQNGTPTAPVVATETPAAK